MNPKPETSKLNSCIYSGTVNHRRATPVEHAFCYRLFWLYLDLDEWDTVREEVFGLSNRRFSPASFRRTDHLGDPSHALGESVRKFVFDKTASDLATGPIRLLTQPSSFGLYFSPLNIYYCFDHREQLTCVVAEVNNTPWGEQHCYVLWSGNREPGEGAASNGQPLAFSHGKDFHVSPFMPMDQTYHWRLCEPAQNLDVGLGVSQNGVRCFEAGMSLTRQPLTSRTIASHLARSPVNAARVLTAIYYQALRLWIKRCPYFPHPKNQSTELPTA